MSKRLFCAAGMAALSLAAAAGARAQETAVPEGEARTVEEVAVIAKDQAGLIERVPSSTVNGIDKPIIETARSVTFASGLTLERYGIQTVDDLVSVAPGSFTASFYGVPGSVALRGTLGELYFRGFKRVENRGTYASPLGAVEQVEVVRGPPTAYMGPGKVGGFLNFVPKTARVEGRFLSRPTGEIKATAGTYGKKNLSGQIGLPANFGKVEGGVYVYGELEDSDSFYRGIHPKHQLVELSSDFNLGSGFTVSFGGMFYHASGYIQTAGWNRLTQDLIDNGNYITGRDTDIVDSDGNGRLTPNEIGATLTRGYTVGTAPAFDRRFQLDTGVGAGRISPRQVFVSDRDFSNTQTQTYYLDFGKRFSPDHSVKLQFFYDRLGNNRFSSYGFPASYDTFVAESRLSWNGRFASDDGRLVVKTLAGLSWRYTSANRRESTSSIALDRRDILFGPTGTDVLDDPFSTEPGNVGLKWDLSNIAKWHDRGAFAIVDASFGRANLVLSGRLDDYSVKSQDVGSAASAANRRGFKDGRGKGSYTISGSYKIPVVELMPYFTYAQTAAVEVSQASDVNPSLVGNKSWVSNSDLREIGVKGQWLDGALLASVSAYRQTRTSLNQISNTITGHRSKGIEVEVRWIASKNLSFTVNGNDQKSIVKGPDNGFIYIPSFVALTPGANGFGGGYAVFAYSSFPERRVDYRITSVPRNVVSAHATYVTDPADWGRVGVTVGGKHVTKTSGTVPGAVRYPAYTVANASVFYERGPWSATLNVDNLFDKLYFTPVADVYANVSVLPSMGRQARITLKRAF